MTSSRCCIIGAGAAGLAALKVLLDHGVEVDCFEKSGVVGGHWHTDYESLHLITSRDVSGFAGFRMPEHYPVYPSRDQMRDYIESFADRFDLRRHVVLNTEVTSVTPRGPRGQQGWTVQLAGGETRDYDAVLVANGHLTDPYVPDYPGTFTGKALHSSDYSNAADLEGARVLVVGVGNSGCDLVVDAVNARLDAHISIRQGQLFQPKAIFGRPRAELRWLSRLPLVVQERVTRALIDVVIGRNSAYRGLPEPATRNLNRQRPVIANLLLYWIQHGRITARPGLARFEGRTAHFVDGTSTEYDTVLWATGFRTTLPFLDESLLERRNGVPLRVGGLAVPVGLENLYFIGMAAPRGPQLPVYSAQAELVAEFLELKAQDPGLQLSAHLAARQEPDDRIDIVRPIWQKQMERTRKEVARLRRRRGRAAAPTLGPSVVETGASVGAAGGDADGPVVVAPTGARQAPG